MLTQTIMNLALVFGFVGLLCLWAAIGEQRRDPEYKEVHMWFYMAIPCSLLHLGFYLWYAVRIGP